LAAEAPRPETDARTAPRWELKLVCQEGAYERLGTFLRVLPQGLRTLHPPRRVQSVYLDTAGQRALEDNLAGISRREKMRLRWYGDLARGVAGTLERKIRENTLGWKQLAPLAAPLDVEGVDRHAFVRRLVSLAPEAWRHALEAGLEPAQWISYRRDYWTSADGRVRVTVDRGLEAWDQRWRLVLGRSQPTLLPRVLVVELKCAAEDHDLARAIASRLPLSVDRCSKYVLACDRSHGPVASFLPF
jgi:hypothetical protein